MKFICTYSENWRNESAIEADFHWDAVIKSGMQKDPWEGMRIYVWEVSWNACFEHWEADGPPVIFESVFESVFRCKVAFRCSSNGYYGGGIELYEKDDLKGTSWINIENEWSA